MRGLERSKASARLCNSSDVNLQSISPMQDSDKKILAYQKHHIHSASLMWSRYLDEMHTPPCLGCSLCSGSGLLYIAVKATTERRLSKLGGVGSLRGSVAISIVRIKSRDFHLLADR